ncbi:MAG TPA: hypothetical protein V6D22_24540 [Candidatus Obscuribacterales bacterium]
MLISSKRKRLFIAAMGILAAVAGNSFIRRADANAGAAGELAKMFEQDQADRKTILTHPQPGQWEIISAHDKQHHDRILELMRQDKLKSADDFYYAAMIMQHGSDTKDFSLAHIFAMAAAQKGHKLAPALSALSFDRLMLSVGQPQIFGSQSCSEANAPYKLTEPMQLDLITDSIRKEFNTQTIPEAKEWLNQLNARRKSIDPQ